MKTTVTEAEKITGVSTPICDVRYVIVGMHRGWCSGPGSGVRTPDETRVDRVTRSHRVAAQAHMAGERVYLTRREYRPGDILAIHDGRDVAAELGLGSSDAPDMILMGDEIDAYCSTPQFRAALSCAKLTRLLEGGYIHGAKSRRALREKALRDTSGHPGN